MNVSKAYHDGLVQTRDDAMAEARKAQDNVDYLMACLDAAVERENGLCAELDEAKSEVGPSDMALDVLAAIHQPLIEMMNDVIERHPFVSEGVKDQVKTALMCEYAQTVAQLYEQIDPVLSNWVTGMDNARTATMAENILATLTSMVNEPCPYCDGRTGECKCALDDEECNDPDCVCRQSETDGTVVS